MNEPFYFGVSGFVLVVAFFVRYYDTIKLNWTALKSNSFTYLPTYLPLSSRQVTFSLFLNDT